MEDIENEKETDEIEEDSQIKNSSNHDDDSEDNSDHVDDEHRQESERDNDNTVLENNNTESESKLNSKQANKEESINGKKKVREGKPFTKVVIRRLPPSMTKDIFLDQVSPLPSYDYFYFVSASTASTPGGFSRAYINFINQNDLFDFTRTFDNYVFIDNRGHEYPAIVEFAPYQRVPKTRAGRKKDTLVGTIESDPVYVTFKEQLEAEALENSRTTNKQHYFETEISENEEIITTPLLEYLKQRRAEKDRIREEKREDRKRKEIERKLLKNKIKEKPVSIQGSGVTSVPSTQEDVQVKVLQPPKEKKDINYEKDVKRERTKHKDKEERYIKPENRSREFKNKGGKSYREERLKQAEKREERKKKENEELSKEKEELTLSVTDRIAADEEDKFYNDKKKWKYGGGGDGKPGRTFVSKRREDKKKDIYDKKRNNNSTKPFSRNRKGSGESVDDNKKSESSETQEKEEKQKEEPAIKKEKENKNKATEETNIKKASTLITTSTSAQSHKDDKDNKVLTDKINDKKDRLQKESSVDSEEGSKAKDPRAERRIRNKDRPSIEIYRPGMGKFSRQRLEKEKTLGSTDESPSHSPSPQPSNNNKV